MEFLVLLMPLLTQLLPLLLNKPAEQSKAGFLRRGLRYQQIADGATDPMAKAAFAEAADICMCCAEADEAGRADIVGAITQASAGVESAMQAMAAVKGA